MQYKKLLTRNKIYVNLLKVVQYMYDNMPKTAGVQFMNVMIYSPAEEKFKQTFYLSDCLREVFFGGKFYKEVKRWQRLNLRSL